MVIPALRNSLAQPGLYNLERKRGGRRRIREGRREKMRNRKKEQKNKDIKKVKMPDHHRVINNY